MDKRNLLFVFAISLSFIAVQFFFRHQDMERKQEWAAQQERLAERKNKELAADLQHRVPHVHTLPLVETYEDLEGHAFFGNAIQMPGDVVLVGLSDHTLPKLPSTLYVRPFGSSELLKPLPLTRNTSEKGGLAVYGKDSKYPLEVGSSRDLTDDDLYFISLPVTNVPRDGVQIALGAFQDGKLSFPGQAIKKWVPEADAFVLSKTAKGYLPVAYYANASQTVTPLNQLQDLRPFAEPARDVAKLQEAKEERFYVIEDAYQQLVFSNRGGALVEINLPYNNAKDPLSVVKEVAIDREMVDDDPINAQFPLLPFYTPAIDAKGSYVYHAQGKQGGYYPLLRRDLFSKKGGFISKVPARYYALNLVSDYPETAELHYDVVSFDERHIVFSASHLDKKITKTFRLPEDAEKAPYTLDLEVVVEGHSSPLWLTSGVPEVEIISGSDAASLKYRITRAGSSKVELIDLPKESSFVGSFHPDWVSNSNGFFGIIMDPQTETAPGYEAIRVPPKEMPSRLLALDPKGERWSAASYAGYEILMPLKKKAGVNKFRIFAGPFAESVLKSVDSAYTDPVTQENPDYIASQTFHGWFAFISEPFARFLFFLMKGFYWLTHSWGWSIILLTVALRVILYPLNAWSARSMAAMQAIGPEAAAIDVKHAKNPALAQQEKLALYRERGVNPLGGCLPLLLQAPFMIGLYDLLKSTFELRGACFIPGWIDDLAAPDVLFSWKQPIFFIGNQLHLLPILLGLVMFAQQRLSAPPAAPNMTDQQRQQRAMGPIMAVMFTAMFYQFPSGLNIYWLFSMLLGMAQQIYTNRTYKLPVGSAGGKKDSVVEVKGKRVS